MNISSHMVYKFVEKAYVECGYSVGYVTSLYRLAWLWSVERSGNLIKDKYVEIWNGWPWPVWDNIFN